MDKKDFVSSLTQQFKKHNLTAHLSFEKTEAFHCLTEHLLTENEKFNLTAITDEHKIILLHYVDSLMLLPYLKKGAKVADIGTGAGFPALPLALCREDLTVHAFDGTDKRIRYVNETAALLGLKNLTAETMRAETGAKDPLYREKYDAVVARGVAELRTLCEYCLPYVKVGGVFLAMKGSNAAREAQDAKRAIAMLGGKLKSVEAATLSAEGEQIQHQIVIIEKVSKTPALYPRENNQITKKPL
ncbi:MAG: 16S rRNA (guanine(527)-N(7))-methyltransferase RsmG [Clostridia bacterium]|nr:16S rRNA (guanine(527)-N(7))-methyltransferase RsmG [Clostridia bacterium]MBO7150209.1 16S rRNA (guanine(527)-N(7))-methyltransferase RsmG [Clostridia bacterium]